MKKNAFLIIAILSLTILGSGLEAPALADTDAEQAKVEKAAPLARPQKAAGNAAERDETYEVEALVDGVSAPVNPHETILTVTDGQMKQVEVIISPATRYEPGDYYPAEGDKIRLYYAVLGSVRKRQYAYVITFVEDGAKNSTEAAKDAARAEGAGNGASEPSKPAKGGQ